MYRNQKVFEGEINVKYVFNKSYKPTNGLIIVFSAFQPLGNPPGYNYGRVIEEFDCNKLFILDDFGARASYYLCANKDYSIERSVIQLINEIIKENNISTVISAGSSKGGYAALYYGIKYGFDYIISASPQYLLGDYLIDQVKRGTKEVVDFMVGSSNRDEHDYLNNIMRNMIKETNHSPNIFIHLGKGEMHYKKHVTPLLKDLDASNLKYTLDLGDYNKHSDVAKAFPPILKSKIRECLGYQKLEIEIEDIGENHYRLIAKKNMICKTAWYVYCNDKRIDVTKYALDNELIYKFVNPGIYKVKAFTINEIGLRVSLFSKEITV